MLPTAHSPLVSPEPSLFGQLFFVMYHDEASMDRCSLFSTPLTIAIAQRHDFQVHSYEDDTQLYFHDKAESCERRVPRITECIAAIESKSAKMNTDQTDFIWLGSKHHR